MEPGAGAGQTSAASRRIAATERSTSSSRVLWLDTDTRISRRPRQVVAPSQPQRSDEELLTGSTAQQVEDAVRAKYPGATFVRIETDSDGVYEAHITKADGTPLTVELDKSFAITGEEQMGGPGHGPGGSGSA